MSDEPAILRAALLWLRNHYDYAARPRRPRHDIDVLTRIDAVLKDYEPSIADVQKFRAAYPVRAQYVREGRGKGGVTDLITGPFYDD
jgi:hypothetical protein